MEFYDNLINQSSVENECYYEEFSNEDNTEVYTCDKSNEEVNVSQNTICYFVPKPQKKKSKLFRFIDNIFSLKNKIFGKKKKRKHDAKHLRTYEYDFSANSVLINYAFNVKRDKDKYMALREQYLNFKNKDSVKASQLLKQVSNLQYDLRLSESFINIKIAEIQQNDNLDDSEKRDLIEYVYNILGIKGDSCVSKISICDFQDIPDETKVPKHLSNTEKIQYLKRLREELIVSEEVNKPKPKHMAIR